MDASRTLARLLRARKWRGGEQEVAPGSGAARLYLDFGENEQILANFNQFRTNKFYLNQQQPNSIKSGVSGLAPPSRFRAARKSEADPFYVNTKREANVNKTAKKMSKRVSFQQRRKREYQTRALLK